MEVGGFIFGDLAASLQHLYRDIFSSLGGRGNVAASFIYDVGLKRCKNTHVWFYYKISRVI